MSAPLDTAGVFGVTLPPRPYPGLRPFSQDEWPIFFGREQMVDDVVGRLAGQRLLVVHGDSGCGKSSLIRAGVLPRLEQEAARGGRRWITRIVTPGDEPLARLASALAGTPGTEETGTAARTLKLRRILNCGRDGSAALIDDVCGSRDPYVCLLIDQFEELFAHARRRGPQQANLLVDQLLGLKEAQAERLFVVLTMRSEFLGACAKFEGFAAAVNETQYLLPRMQHTDLVRAIREPATLYDGEIAIELAERLIAEARGSQDELPLIQHGLMRLHARTEAADGKPWRLTLDDYGTPGGLGGLLSDHADEVMARAEPEVRGGDARVTQDLFCALTDINADGQATRYPRRLRDLIAITRADEAAVRRIIDAFRAEGISFMRPYGTEPIGLDEHVDISHEALIRCWKKIADPIDGWLTREFKNGLVWRSLLVQADSFEQDPSNVLSPATAEERHRWLQRRNADWAERYGGGWPRVEALVKQSVAERERQIQAEVEARAREEQVKLREEQARLQAQTLQSELAVAVEKGRRVAVFRRALVVSVLLSGIVLFLAYQAWQARGAAENARALEAALRMRAEDRSELAAEQNAKLESALNQIKEQLASLQAAADKRPTDSALREQIAKADDTITKGVTALLSPRVYIHIADESQRAPANELRRRLDGSRVGDTALIVPPIDRISGRPPRPQLRCFVADECETFGKPLVELVNRQLSAPKLRLQDFSGTYTPDGRIRPLHFEIYFPSEPLVLERLDAKAAY